MATSPTPAVAYYRTSGTADVAADRDSQRRQADAVAAYAKERHDIVAGFSDAAVPGADPIEGRAGFADLLAYCAIHKIDFVLIENATRFAHDLAVQAAGHALLQAKGIELVAVDAPTYFMPSKVRTHAISHRPIVQRLLRMAYPFNSICTIRRGPLKGYKIVVGPSMGATYIWGAQDWDWVGMVGRGQCVYDIGANYGQSTLHLANAVGSAGKVIALEPVPENFGRLQRNVEVNRLRQVTAVCAAAGADNGTAQFEFEEDASTRGRLSQGGGLQVRQLALDSYMAMGWPAPSFLKVDVEGGAPAVFAGARNLFKTCRPIIYLECHSPQEFQAAKDLADDGYSIAAADGHPTIDRTEWWKPLICRPR